MHCLTIEDTDTIIISLLYLRDIENVRQVNQYFKSLCDKVLHDKIDNANRKANNILPSKSFVTVQPSGRHTLIEYKKLMLYLDIIPQHYSITPCNTSIVYHIRVQRPIKINLYQLSIQDYDLDSIDIIDNICKMRNFLRHALYDGLIIKF
jgi:hypothetical protein